MIMDYFNKKRFSGWLVIGLLIINLAAISTILFHIISEKRTSVETSAQDKTETLFANELGLSKEQNEGFISAMQKYHQHSREILDEMTARRSEMLEELAKQNPDTLVLHTIAGDIGNLHSTLKLLTIDNFLELKKICTPEQEIKLSGMFKEMLETEGHFKGMGRQYRHGRGGGKQQ
jgi:uncharacterized membrane protein